MTRRQFIERNRRQIYGDQPSDDANISVNLVNFWLSDAIALAAKTNYKENIAVEGISYVNGSFYSRFQDISVTSDGNFTWKIQMPQIPVGIGATEGISTIQFVSDEGLLSLPLIPISENQRTYFQTMRPIPNKTLYYYQGQFIYVLSTLILSSYTATVTMVSGGDATDLDSTLNVPPDYFPVMVEYLKQQLMFQRQVPVDDQNDGLDAITTT